VADDECHLLRGAERGGDDQIALALAVVVGGVDDELNHGKSVENIQVGIGQFDKKKQI
jgi:hypothetical protein